DLQFDRGGWVADVCSGGRQTLLGRSIPDALPRGVVLLRSVEPDLLADDEVALRHGALRGWVGRQAVDRAEAARVQLVPGRRGAGVGHHETDRRAGGRQL